jgi:hypothetical protein
MDGRGGWWIGIKRGERSREGRGRSLTQERLLLVGVGPGWRLTGVIVGSAGGGVGNCMTQVGERPQGKPKP